MIIEIKQTAANLKLEFTIFHDGEYAYDGKLGRWHRNQGITLSKNGMALIEGTFRPTPWLNYIPFKHLFGRPSIRRHFSAHNGEIEFKHVLEGLYQSCFVITAGGDELRAYSRSIGSFHYISICRVDPHGTEEQIALVETHLTTQNNLFFHKLYLLDTCAAYKDALSIFVLYYHNDHFSQRDQISVGTTVRQTWTYSRYNEMYDHEWRESNFPEDNYRGKISHED